MVNDKTRPVYIRMTNDQHTKLKVKAASEQRHLKDIVEEAVSNILDND